MKRLLYILLFVPLAFFGQTEKLVMLNSDIRGINNRLFYKIEKLPKQLSGKKCADNKVGFLLGVNYFSKSSIKGSGIIGSVIYDLYLHNIFSLTGEFAFSYNTIDPNLSALNGGLHKFGLLLGPAIKLHDNKIRAFFRIGVAQDKYIMVLDKMKLFSGDQINSNMAYLFSSDNLNIIPDNISYKDNFIIYKIGLDGFCKLNDKLDLVYSFGYIFANKRYYENRLVETEGEFKQHASVSFTIGATYNILKK
tara:strand:+ start:30 stop:779 length:750 start_codon:yes stop_codon:yes gene_type:complete